MGHLRQVGNYCLAVNVLAEGQRNFCVLLRRVPIGGLEELAQFHRYLARIGKLNSHGVFPGIGARMLIRSALVARARSRSRTHDLVTRTPLAG
jgi:hypothetical protein